MFIYNIILYFHFFTMKKIFIFTTAIILFSLVFSSGASANSQEWIIERSLQINTIVEEIHINFPEIQERSFRNQALQRRYVAFINLDTQLRDEILREFRRWNLSRTTMADINHNYRNFIYFTNKTFLYHEIEEQIWRSQQTVNALQNWYDTMRTYFQRVKTSVKNN